MAEFHDRAPISKTLTRVSPRARNTKLGRGSGEMVTGCPCYQLGMS
jgi:hypothetical protein